ncbi:PfkB family carbohydrate kinase [Bosea sp. 685]|uniref:PfkB family carbohydrate kinase n=1 Tax=Bosea sp. 685 TaxID=3080057 RepID=UPI0028936C63|nr:PfkB family carbohydrate kinase [Bosea sp. 685]WNJ91558.1 PfkB family carbohydrate kinase [Bosea sp. 685]
MKRRIVCVGNLVHDEVFQVDALPSSGIKTGVLDYQSRFGGPAATAAVAICSLGGVASYWGRVGADAAGEAAIRIMSGHGVDCAGVAMIRDCRTLRAIVLVDGRGERSIVSDRRGLPPDPAVLPTDPLDDVAVVLVDSRWPAGAEIALDRARAAGISTVLDADGGTPADNERLVAKADHVVFSSEGLRDFAGEGAPDELLRRCAGGPGKVFAVTRGAAGSLWLLGGEIVCVPSFQVVMADTTGCGDVFHGAYALGLGEGMPPLEAARFATAAAALKGERAQGWNGMADRTAVASLMAAEAVA